MPYTVNSCFEKFRSEVVDLDSTRSATALVSRNNLMTNIDRLSEKGRIPVLYPERHIAFGSFARKTKISPLDDIDLMIAIHGQGGHYSVVRHNAEYHIFIDLDACRTERSVLEELGTQSPTRIVDLLLQAGNKRFCRNH